MGSIPREMKQPMEVGEHLELLVGRKVAVRPGPVIDAKSSLVVCATYDRDGGELACVLMCELPVAAGLSAALTLMPPGVAKDAVRSGGLDRAMMDNFSEVANICAQLVQVTSYPRSTMSGTFQSGMGIPEEIMSFLESAELRGDYMVDMMPYAQGSMAMFIKKPVY